MANERDESNESGNSARIGDACLRLRECELLLLLMLIVSILACRLRRWRFERGEGEGGEQGGHTKRWREEVNMAEQNRTERIRSIYLYLYLSVFAFAVAHALANDERSGATVGRRQLHN